MTIRQIKRGLAAGFFCAICNPANAFDLLDYANIYDSSLNAYVSAVEQLQLAAPIYDAVVDVGVANSCIVASTPTGQIYSTGEIDYSLKASDNYAATFEIFQISEGQCEALFDCEQQDLICRANRRACLASAVSANEVMTSEMDGKSLSDLITDYETTNLGQASTRSDFNAMRAELDYVTNNGEAQSYASVVIPTAADVLGDLETALLMNHAQGLVDTALGVGLSVEESDAAESARAAVCEDYSDKRRAFVSALNEVVLAYAPMIGARAGYRAGVEVFLSNESCSFLPSTEPWIFD